MNRATWLQDRRIQRFRDVLSRWKRKELSAMEAGELLGCSERQFRRYRTRTGAGCRFRYSLFNAAVVRASVQPWAPLRPPCPAAWARPCVGR